MQTLAQPEAQLGWPASELPDPFVSASSAEVAGTPSFYMGTRVRMPVLMFGQRALLPAEYKPTCGKGMVHFFMLRFITLCKGVLQSSLPPLLRM